LRQRSERHVEGAVTAYGVAAASGCGCVLQARRGGLADAGGRASADSVIPRSWPEGVAAAGRHRRRIDRGVGGAIGSTTLSFQPQTFPVNGTQTESGAEEMTLTRGRTSAPGRGCDAVWASPALRVVLADASRRRPALWRPRPACSPCARGSTGHRFACGCGWPRGHRLSTPGRRCSCPNRTRCPADFPRLSARSGRARDSWSPGLFPPGAGPYIAAIPRRSPARMLARRADASCLAPFRAVVSGGPCLSVRWLTWSRPDTGRPLVGDAGRPRARRCGHRHRRPDLPDCAAAGMRGRRLAIVPPSERCRALVSIALPRFLVTNGVAEYVPGMAAGRPSGTPAAGNRSCRHRGGLATAAACPRFSCTRTSNPRLLYHPTSHCPPYPTPYPYPL